MNQTGIECTSNVHWMFNSHSIPVRFLFDSRSNPIRFDFKTFYFVWVKKRNSTLLVESFFARVESPLLYKLEAKGRTHAEMLVFNYENLNFYHSQRNVCTPGIILEAERPHLLKFRNDECQTFQKTPVGPVKWYLFIPSFFWFQLSLPGITPAPPKC